MKLSDLSESAVRQLKRRILLLAVVFVVIFGMQFVFVSWQVRETVIASLRSDVQDINKALNYTSGPDLPTYNKAYLEANAFQLINADGTVIDTEGTKSAYAPDFLPRVTMPWLNESKGRPVSYVSPLGERWLLLTVPIGGGYGVLGLSQYDTVSEPETMLIENAQYFPDDVTRVAEFNPSRVSNDVQHAIVTQGGRLLRASGRLPFHVDPMAVGRDSVGAGDREGDNGIPYHVLYVPLTDSGGKAVGTIIAYQETSQERAATRNMLLFIVALGILSFGVYLLLSTSSQLKHEAEKEQIRAAFQNYFSPAILDAILKDPKKLDSQRREITVMFSDIRSFTTLSEQLPSRQLSAMLQEYFDEMTEEVVVTEGVVDKFIGDALMVFWGAPIEQVDHANRAVSAAVGMVKRLQTLNAKWASLGIPAIDIGIGINLGVATIGNVGSKQRFDYTVIGDMVNVASRIEGKNKDFNSHILISESTKKHLTLNVETRDLGKVSLKGRDEQIRIFEVPVPS